MTAPSSAPQPPQPQAAPVPQQAAPQGPWQGAPGAYTSPIPVRRTHLGHALASEWTKIKSVRSTMWTLGVFLLLVVGIGLLIAVTVSSADGSLVGTPLLSLGFFGLLVGSICIITLGVLTTSSEYGTGMIRTTMTACPSRGRVLMAKAIIFFAVSFVITLLSTGLVAVVQQAALSDMGAADPTTSEWLRATLGVSLYIALLGLLALSIGALLRHSAGGITIMIGLLLAPLVLALFMFAESMNDFREFLLEYSIPNQLGAFYGGTLSDSGPTGWDPLWIMLGLAAAGLVGAFAVLESRDV
ncbi:ABC transporter permease [Streptomyces sp. NBC_01304]|uniref:ABC transporter permease n=1 Tax=Streptomyces sp. NBC_01304 TaxID=2903818 RepID=UPI002E1344A6|nr:alkaline shock response membrane anchor protein AmaP [Streptomyces sp. NBC_01304]